MGTWAIIPVKHLREAKSSLSVVLEPGQRQQLVLSMLADVLNAVRQASSISGAAVVSPDKKGLDFARLHGATDVVESGLELNAALKSAIKHALGRGATSVLILPGDLPLLKSADIENLTAMATTQRDVVIAPSKANGTNALLIRPPDLINLRFGGESFPLHVQEAFRVGVKARVYRSPSVATDIDEPTDLLSIETLGIGTRSCDFLFSIKAGVQTRS
jgi:2-phospho-L-lactate guanylyltransferase